MRKGFLFFFLCALLFLPLLLWAAGEKPTIGAPCTSCHQEQPNILRGIFQSASGKAQTIQMQTGTATWLVRFDADTKLVGAERISKIPLEKEIAVNFEMRNGEPLARTITIKPPAKVAPEKLISAEEVLKLVNAGPEKANYVLVDSRPLPKYQEGHIPTAVSLPLAAFDKLKNKILPQDKAKLIIFYCAGVT